MEKNISDITPPLDILVVGSNMIDLLTHINQLPKIGETLIGESFKLGFGGKGANQAVMAAKLGARVGMITKVGDDVFGSMTIENFSRMGIAEKRVFIKEGVSSGVAPIFVDRDGNNIIVVIPGANQALTPDEVASCQDLFKSAGIVISQFEISDDTILKTFRMAKEAGSTTILNPAPAKETNPELISLSDIIIPNEIEIETLTRRQITGHQSLVEASSQLVQLGAKNIIVTLGGNGAFLYNNEHQELFPSFEVETIDTTGAGDAFIGSFAYALANNYNIREAIQFANASAALSVTKEGTQTSFHTLDEIVTFYNQG